MENHIKSTKEKILETSLKLFIKKGFTDVSMNELLATVGLTKGAFYHYFESKDQLVDEVIKNYIFYYLDEISNVNINTSETLESSLERILNSTVKYENLLKSEFGDSGLSIRSFFLLLMEGIKKYPHLAEYYLLFQKRNIANIKAIIEYGILNGVVKKNIDSDEAADFVFSCHEGLFMQYMMNSDRNFDAMVSSSLSYLMTCFCE